MSRNEKYLPYILALVLPVLSTINTSLEFKSEAFHHIHRYLSTSAILLIIWFLNTYLINKDSYLTNKLSRPGAIILLNSALVCLLVFLEVYAVPTDIRVTGMIPPLFLGTRLLAGIVIYIMIINSLKTLREREELKRQNLSLQSITLKAQLESLKQQLNPHFLFNSLNTLIDLIEEDSESAVEFVRHFSYIYRVVLQSTKHDMVSLKDELDFLEVYWKLLQTRFKTSIKMRIDVDEQAMDKQIPPLSIQLLIENAVKHNEVSKEKPLLIEVESDSHSVVVMNTYSPKAFSVKGEGFGLQNLKERFEFLMEEPIEFGVQEDKYRVILPLKD